MSSVLWAPSERSASEPEPKPAASLTTARIALAPIEAAAVRCLRVARASSVSDGLVPKPRGPMILGLILQFGGVMLPGQRPSKPDEEADGISAYDDSRDRHQGDGRFFRAHGLCRDAARR